MENLQTFLPYDIELLFQQYYRQLCLFANNVLNDEALAEDIVQSFFAGLCEGRNTLPEHEGARKGYLFIAIRNNCLKHIRSEKVKSKYFDQLDKDMIEEQTIMDAMIQAEVISQLMEAINQLPQGCKQVLHMAIFEKFSNDEIATNLAISINTVKSQKKRAIQLLRTRLDPQTLSLLLLLLIE
ncbi:RNA polymerase sigma-70 factor [Sphingobacterium sp. HMA12]|uniref:RNA polymerase sigma-70 factor n=1 Tax=Sphingobacterium sp. HMA12 TaxID=2050894 RepID=UPI0013159AF1|nr:RNA polymerase sigma-70 factor [Sphingobacterium sp. HMA12]